MPLIIINNCNKKYLKFLIIITVFSGYLIYIPCFCCITEYYMLSILFMLGFMHKTKIYYVRLQTRKNFMWKNLFWNL